ncbi:MAG: CoA ester lyase [Asticcacaulis sp.]
MVSDIQGQPDLSEAALRSVLFVPAANIRALEKLAQLKVDAVIIDLEDSVGVAERETAIAHIRLIAGQGGLKLRPTLLRISGDAEGLAAGAALMPLGFAGIVVPKVEGAADLERVAKVCGGAIWAMIETPLGVVNLKDICGANVALQGLIAGPNDLRHGLRSIAAEDRADIAQALSLIVLHGRAAGLRVIDGVYNNFRDEAGLQAECVQGRQFGFDGKTLIHPAQIDIANQAFGASEAEREWARAVVAAFAQPENADKGVVSVSGEMVERMHLERARQWLIN